VMTAGEQAYPRFYHVVVMGLNIYDNAESCCTWRRRHAQPFYRLWRCPHPHVGQQTNGTSVSGEVRSIL